MTGITSPLQENEENFENKEALFEEISEKIKSAKEEVDKVIYGQHDVIDLTLTTLLSGGHVLLIGVPGLAKTLLVETMAKVQGLSSSRIQCTPDLMPADIIGSEILEEDSNKKRSFRFVKGPIFAQFIMADEINRATPRTQSALLQAMQENTVSVTGQTYNLPRPFHVLATQNPIEQEGTYPLPEAQLDRFMMQIDVNYPAEDSERKMMLATTTGSQTPVNTVFSEDDLIKAQNLIRLMPISDSVVDTILKLVRSARPSDEALDIVKSYVEWAPGPRASQSLMLTCRAKALLDGRMAPSADDVLELAEPVLKHRMKLNFQARSDGLTLSEVIRAIRNEI